MHHKLFPDCFLKSQNGAYFWANIVKFYTVCSYYMSSSRLLETYRNQAVDNQLLPCTKHFIKQAELQNQSPCLNFCIIFEEKYFSSYILLLVRISLSGCLYFVRYWAICVLQLYINQVASIKNIFFQQETVFSRNSGKFIYFTLCFKKLYSSD